MRVYRISHKRHAATMWSGEGGMYADGRWSTKGHRVVYSAQTYSLAAMELYVNLDDRGALGEYVWGWAEWEELPVKELLRAAMPSGWDLKPPGPVSKALGDVWIERAREAILEVPSVLSEVEVNYLINPSHRDYAHIVFGAPQPFLFDERMLGRRPKGE